MRQRVRLPHAKVTLEDRVTFKYIGKRVPRLDGPVEASNFHDYVSLRMNEMPFSRARDGASARFPIAASLAT